MMLTKTPSITMNGLYQAAMGIRKRCNDVNIDFLSSASVVHDREYGRLHFQAPLTGLKNAELIQDGGYVVNGIAISAKLNRWSFKQLCSKNLLGIPYIYMKKCIDSSSPEIQNLFEQNVNTHLSKINKAACIRLYLDEKDQLYVRGIVSPSYSIFDSHSVLETMMDTMDGPQFSRYQFQIMGHHIDETGVQARFVLPDKMDIDGEDLFAGFIVTSGEIGNRNLKVQFFIWKEVCSNGLVVAKGIGNMLMKRHRGICEDSFISSLEDTVKMLPKFSESAKAIVHESRGKALSRDAIRHLLDRFESTVKISKEEREKITDLTFNQYGATRWGYINALTEFAQDERFDIDTRTEIETYAGVLFATGSKMAA